MEILRLMSWCILWTFWRGFFRNFVACKHFCHLWL